MQGLVTGSNNQPGGEDMDARLDIQTATTGGIGVVSSLASILISLTDLEASIRIVSLLVGLAVSLSTLVKLWTKPRRKNKSNDPG